MTITDIETCLVVIYTLNVLLHSIGIFLIINILMGRNVELVYISHLSISEISISLLYVIQYIVCICRPSAVQFTKYFVDVAVSTLFSIVYYLCMLYVTIDRLVACLPAKYKLPNKYTEFWTIDKAKYLLIGTWVISIIMCVLAEVLAEVSSSVSHFKDIVIYFYLPFDCIFIVIAITAYCSMVFYYREAVRKKEDNYAKALNRRGSATPTHIMKDSNHIRKDSNHIRKNSNNTRKDSRDHVLYNQRKRASSISSLRLRRGSSIPSLKRRGSAIKEFYTSNRVVSGLLILKFFVFNVVPNFTYLISIEDDLTLTSTIVCVVRITFAISFFVDGVIYIFCQPNLRFMLFSNFKVKKNIYKEKLTCWRKEKTFDL